MHTEWFFHSNFQGPTNYKDQDPFLFHHHKRGSCYQATIGDLELEEVSGFVTCSYNGQWWLVCVLKTHTKVVQISLALLHPPSSYNSYKYSDVPVIITVTWPLTEILIKVCPHSQTGHGYTLTQGAP